MSPRSLTLNLILLFPGLQALTCQDCLPTEPVTPNGSPSPIASSATPGDVTATPTPESQTEPHTEPPTPLPTLTPAATPTSTGPPSDRDRDGFAPCQSGEPDERPCDCDDHEPLIYPGAPERDDAIDDDCDGYVEWVRELGGYDGQLVEVIAAPDGGIVAIGSRRRDEVSHPHSGLWVVKLSTGGDILWSRTHGGDLDDYGVDILNHPDGGYLAVGTTESEAVGQRDVWLLMLDDEGEIVWDRTFGDGDYESAAGLAKNPSGGYVVGANKGQSQETTSPWLLYLDAEGSLAGEHQYAEEVGNNRSSLVDLAVAPSGEIALVDYGCDDCIAIVSSDGTLPDEQWSNSLRANCSRVETSSHGTFLLSSGNQSSSLKNLSTIGEIIWWVGGTYEEGYFGTTQLSDGIVVTTTSVRIWDYYPTSFARLVEYSEEGALLRTANYDGIEEGVYGRFVDVMAMHDDSMIVLGTCGPPFVVKTDDTGLSSRVPCGTVAPYLWEEGKSNGQ